MNRDDFTDNIKNINYYTLHFHNSNTEIYKHN